MFYRHLHNPCGYNHVAAATARNPNDAMNHFSNATTSDVLKISRDKIDLVNSLAIVHKHGLNELTSRLSLDHCEDLDEDAVLPHLNFLPELNRLSGLDNSATIGLERLEVLYKAFLTLAASYKVMADDWDIGERMGDRCNTIEEARLRQNEFNRVGDKVFGELMCSLMMHSGDEGHTHPTWSMKDEIYDVIGNVEVFHEWGCRGRLNRDCLVHRTARRILDYFHRSTRAANEQQL